MQYRTGPYWQAPGQQERGTNNKQRGLPPPAPAPAPCTPSLTAVTAGGMLISSRLGSTMSPGRSTVKNLVRKAWRGGWVQGLRGGLGGGWVGARVRVQVGACVSVGWAYRRWLGGVAGGHFGGIEKQKQ